MAVSRQPEGDDFGNVENVPFRSLKVSRIAEKTGPGIFDLKGNLVTLAIGWTAVRFRSTAQRAVPTS